MTHADPRAPARGLSPLHRVDARMVKGLPERVTHTFFGCQRLSAIAAVGLEMKATIHLRRA
jgi:hypothetical protein